MTVSCEGMGDPGHYPKSTHRHHFIICAAPSRGLCAIDGDADSDPDSYADGGTLSTKARDGNMELALTELEKYPEYPPGLNVNTL